MIIIRLKGGMGNQMFQYAFGKNLAKKLGTEMRMDLHSLLDRSKGDFVYRDYDLPIFNVEHNLIMNPNFLRMIYRPKISVVTRMVRNYINRGMNYLKENNFHFDPSLVNHPEDNTIYEGWYQSFRYFEGIENELRKDFTFKNGISSESQNVFQKIKNSNSVCLNVRRTDFLKVDNLNTTSKDYFLKAAKFMAEKIDHPHFFVFSDDIEWCREHIVTGYPTEVIGHEHKGERFGNYMQLMIACKHYIIPNSSFAWWAVWLNEHKYKIVVAPKNWFTDTSLDTSDLVPKEWMRI